MEARQKSRDPTYVKRLNFRWLSYAVQKTVIFPYGLVAQEKQFSRHKLFRGCEYLTCLFKLTWNKILKNVRVYRWVSIIPFLQNLAYFVFFLPLLQQSLLRYYRRSNSLIIAPIRPLKMKFALKQCIVNMNCPNILTFNK